MGSEAAQGLPGRGSRASKGSGDESPGELRGPSAALRSAWTAALSFLCLLESPFCTLLSAWEAASSFTLAELTGGRYQWEVRQ